MKRRNDLEKRICQMLANIKRNSRINIILKQLLNEMWTADESDFEWTPEAAILIDGKWVKNPEFASDLALQMDILWEYITQYAAAECQRRRAFSEFGMSIKPAPGNLRAKTL